MFKQMAAGEIKACWIICTNPVASMADRRHVIQALERAELVITQDAFLDTETNRYADILLPGALWAEGEGVMINSERNLTLMQKAVTPPESRCLTGRLSPGWPVRWDTGRTSIISLRKRFFASFSSLPIRRPGTPCRG